MSNLNQYSWVKFYKELANKLLEYKDNRQELIIKIRSVYEETGINLPTLEKDNQIIDMDPFTVFGLFNKSSMREENRIKIISSIAEKFGLSTAVPVSFESIPVLNNQNATFYYFIGDREDDDIENLWVLFEAALKYVDTPTADNRLQLSKYFDIAINRKGNGNSKITMGLYWIAPEAFLNLDSRNEWYIYKSGKVPALVIRSLPPIVSKIAAKKYFEIVEKLSDYLASDTSNLKDFKELSFEAWRHSEEINLLNKKTSVSGVSKASFLRWFKPLIQALRDLGGSATPQQTREKIIENENLSEEIINEIRGKTGVNKFDNEVAFARNYLVYGGYLDNSVHGLWSLTETGKTVDMTDDLASKIFKNGIVANQSKRGNIGEAVADKNVDSIHYWLYAPGDGACKWDEFYHDSIIAIGWGEIGDLLSFANKDEIKAKMKECYGSTFSYKNAAHATWQFANEMKPGDVVFVKKGMHEILGRGVVSSEYEFDDARNDEYKNFRKIEWTHNGKWPHPGQAAMKTLTDITAYTEYVDKLTALFENDSEDDVEEQEIVYPQYSIEDFLREVYMSKESYNTLVGLIRNKQNIILQGAPGVGKTYVAKRLAYSIIGIKNKERVMMVQFHQSYSYEDFIMGYRPVESGFELKKGAFYNFCKKAEIDSDNEYFFIIDEINRGNLSKIFGELFMLIENDKRGVELQLLYSDEKFSVPENLYIIGMMNTADRSLAMLDYAFRRRFAFFEMKPGFDTSGFMGYRMSLNNQKFNRFINCVENLNVAISADESLGEGFCIGHSYFCNLETVEDQALACIVEYELIPLIKEYWFDEPLKVKDWSNNLRSAIK